MYCMKCGVKLADSQEKCPLCGLRVYHPDLPAPSGEKSFPQGSLPPQPAKSQVFSAAATIIFLLPLLLVLFADLNSTGSITWSGYVVGALLVGYVIVILPIWFSNPNPVIFVPCGCSAVLLYLLYIDLVTPNSWFMSFVFPVGGAITLILSAMVTLLHYLKKGRLYIIGGGMMAFGGTFLLSEFLMSYTFASARFIGWSVYPCGTLFLLGSTLIFLAICRSAREAAHRRFFI